MRRDNTIMMEYFSDPECRSDLLMSAIYYIENRFYDLIPDFPKELSSKDAFEYIKAWDALPLDIFLEVKEDRQYFFRMIINLGINIISDEPLKGIFRERHYERNFLFEYTCEALLDNYELKIIESNFFPYSGDNSQLKIEQTSKVHIPALSLNELEDCANAFLRKYCKDMLSHNKPINIINVVQSMGLNIQYMPLDDVVIAQIIGSRIIVNSTCPYATKRLQAFAIIHECVHKEFHTSYIELFEFMSDELFRKEMDEISEWDDESPREIHEIYDQVYVGAEADIFNKSLDDIESQTNAIALRIMMPADAIRNACTMLNHSLEALPLRSTEKKQKIISGLAEYFQVPLVLAQKRAIELGYTELENAGTFVDDVIIPPVSYSEGSLREDETFLINDGDATRELERNQELASLYKAGLIVKTCEKMFSINDPRYVYEDEEGNYHLTRYALDHVDECCLVFNRDTFSFLIESCNISDGFSKKVSEEAKIECNLRTQQNMRTIEKLDVFTNLRSEIDSLFNLMKYFPGNFQYTLMFHMIQRGFCKKESVSPLFPNYSTLTYKDFDLKGLSEKAYISSNSIKSYLQGEQKPEIESVVALCAALNLPPFYSVDLLRKADHDLFYASEENMYYMHLLFYYYSDSRLPLKGEDKYFSKKQNRGKINTLDYWNAILVCLGQKWIPQDGNNDAKDGLDNFE